MPTWCKIKDLCGEERDPASLLVVPEELVSRADEILAQIACDDVLSGIAGQDELPLPIHSRTDAGGEKSGLRLTAPFFCS